MKACWNCGWEWLESRPPPFKETCPDCFSYLHACKNCKLYNPAVSLDCMSPTAEPPQSQEAHNFCEEFVFADRDQVSGKVVENERTTKAKEQLAKLFGNEEAQGDAGADEATPDAAVDDQVAKLLGMKDKEEDAAREKLRKLLGGD